MLLLALGVFKKYWLQFAIAGALAGGVWWFGAHERSIGAAGVQKKFDAAKAGWTEQEAERTKRATDLANLWDAQRLKTEAAEHERDQLRNAQFTALSARVSRLPAAVAAAPVPASVVSVLDDAVSAGNREAAGPAAEPDQAVAAAAGDSDLGKLTRWGIEVIAVCTEYRDRALAWEAFYSSLRNAQ